MTSSYSELQQQLAEHGFLARGGFYPAPQDAVPDLTSGEACGSVVVVGNTGSGDFWPQFQLSAEYHDGLAHPMDRWTERVIGKLAAGLGAEALFPSVGPPYYPFQRWAAKAEELYPSPIGLFISPRWGTWHALRAAILLPEKLTDLPAVNQGASPCLSCVDQPCLTACPVSAFEADQPYDYLACARHLSTDAGENCIEQGCLARRACPVGQDFMLYPAHAAFHMTAFVRARQAELEN
ncbi:ferredoxin [Kiloniella laminariae]|uniref:Ferredoxin n=1 Tax=Kiloniella laminariae TaxID=454162 RepID=A0ABT4LP53_9PROT|nr:ferredoxin [Kiloniella laminariae]MCZ4282888.1 ferredoxin [Kiloniella laminariae]